jgi:hypothetical protein
MSLLTFQLSIHTFVWSFCLGILSISQRHRDWQHFGGVTATHRICTTCCILSSSRHVRHAFVFMQFHNSISYEISDLENMSLGATPRKQQYVSSTHRVFCLSAVLLPQAFPHSGAAIADSQQIDKVFVSDVRRRCINRFSYANGKASQMTQKIPSGIHWIGNRSNLRGTGRKRTGFIILHDDRSGKAETYPTYRYMCQCSIVISLVCGCSQ